MESICYGGINRIEILVQYPPRLVPNAQFENNGLQVFLLLARRCLTIMTGSDNHVGQFFLTVVMAAESNVR